MINYKSYSRSKNIPAGIKLEPFPYFSFELCFLSAEVLFICVYYIKKIFFFQKSFLAEP